MPKAKNTKWPLRITAGSVVVKVYKTQNRGRDLFQIAYRNHLGARQRISCADLERAKSEARTIAMQLQRGEIQALKLQGTDRLAYERAAKTVAEIGVSVDVMAAEYAEAQAALGGHGSMIEAVRFFMAHGGNEMSQISAGDLVQEYLAQKRADGCSARHIEDLTHRLKRFAEAFPGNIGDVSTSQLQRWLNGLKVAARTRNNFRGQLIGLFGFARTQGYLPKNTQTAAQELSKARDKGSEIGIFTPAQMRKLLEAADEEHVRIYLALGAFSGLRTAELQRLEWQDINLKQGHIEVNAAKAKTAQRRLVPIQSNLKAWLKLAATSPGLVFQLKTINHIVADFAREQKIAWPKNGLRHSYASYRLADCLDAPQLALEMGNSPQVIFRNYRELVTPKQAKKWWEIRPSE